MNIAKEYVQGVPTTVENPKNIPILMVIDDLMKESKSSVCDIFTKFAHHKNISVIHLVQNLFFASKEHRNISLNARYIVLTNNVRDKSQIVQLAKQLMPGKNDFLKSAYEKAVTREPYSYLFIDLHPLTEENMHYRSGIFPDDTDAGQHVRSEEHTSELQSP